MKKTILWAAVMAAVAAFIMPAEKSEATITILRDAGNLTRGTLPNARLDPSSVTLQGNSLMISTVASGVDAISNSTSTLFTNLNSTAVALSRLQTAFSTNSIHAGNTSYLNLSGSTQTKSGGLIVNGLVESSSGVFRDLIVHSTISFNGFQVRLIPSVVNNDDAALHLENSVQNIFNAFDIRNRTGESSQGRIRFFGTNNLLEFSNIIQYTKSGNDRLEFLTKNVSGIGTQPITFAPSNSRIGINVTTPTSGLDLLGGSITVRGQDAGIYSEGIANFSSMSVIGTLSSTSGFVMGGSTITRTLSINGITYNFPSAQGAADQVLANNGSGGLSWATDATGGGGGVQNSTFTLVLQAGGDVYKATNSFIPIPGAFGVVGKSTITIFEVQPFTLYPSTVGWVSFNVARSTIMPPSLGSPTTWQYVIANATVGVNAMHGVWISTGFTLDAGWTYSLHITSVTMSLDGAAAAAEYGIKMRGWINEAHGGN